jgi:hypothetical protein
MRHNAGRVGYIRLISGRIVAKAGDQNGAGACLTISPANNLGCRLFFFRSVSGLSRE